MQAGRSACPDRPYGPGKPEARQTRQKIPDEVRPGRPDQGGWRPDQKRRKKAYAGQGEGKVGQQRAAQRERVKQGRTLGKV